ncbi:hypothetical protein QUB80_27275 [Chlorogloeopsis sp. ULAP01]|uniref:YncE family protein n=1 Tax=Chlorogloeopsis sp. ULAP01 TaxID=3056483 RepID=UPI0025AB050F|nr:hypothetical protein [Chlorogloeopsis sp. ULAP01]MDM9384378.1 hypothetical protein [Chlorogloeopsis sp. ULAP01]
MLNRIIEAMFKMRNWLIFGLLLVLVVSGWNGQAIAKDNFEVWLVDQSNSPGVSHGGKIYIYEGSDLMGKHLSSVKPTSVIDLAGKTAQMCSANTGANPVRPHMLLFNSSNSHAILSFVASGHVVIYDAAKREPIACIRTSKGAGGVQQAHAAYPSSDNSYILVANQNGKLLERIDTDYKTNIYTLNPSATIDLANCTTPNGVGCELAGVRPDNAPICPILDSSSHLGFVTLRGGGMFVVNPKSSPMTILAEYDMNTVHGNGCGGAEARSNMYVNSGGGTASNLSQFDVYKFPLLGYNPLNPPNIPTPKVVFSDNTTPDRDAHGMVVTKNQRFVWVGDRAANKIEVISVNSNTQVNTIDLVGVYSNDPTPDLIDIAPSGKLVFISLRGPNPLSADPHVSTGSTPGLGIVKVTEGGKSGMIKGIVPISNLGFDNVERADAHGIKVRIK